MYKILIIEDDEIIVQIVKRHLESWGYEVFQIEDFTHVIQEFVQKDPQLVLLDLKLPFFNGFHWCEEIRKISQVPVMFLSSAADNMNMVMAMSRGADDFIAKPFDLDVLTAKVQAVLRRTYAFGQNNSCLLYTSPGSVRQSCFRGKQLVFVSFFSTKHWQRYASV